MSSKELTHEARPLRHDTTQTIESVSDTIVVESIDESFKDAPSNTGKGPGRHALEVIPLTDVY